MSGIVARIRTRPLVVDGLFAFVCAVVTIVVWAADPDTALWSPTILWHFATLTPIVARRRWPWLAVAGTAATVVVPIWVGPQAWSAQNLVVYVVAYTVASRLPLLPAVLATATTWAPVMLLGTTQSWALGEGPLRVRMLGLLVVNILSAMVCFFIGRTVYTRRAYITALEDRARAAETNQKAIAEQAVADERRRIARELHDVVAHHVSVMSVLAAGVRRTLVRDPTAADEALATIEGTGRTAMREMRRLLNILRAADDDDGGVELMPQPGLAAVEVLVEQLRDAGLPVRLHVTGQPVQLDPGVALTVFRIVQEALTNTLKHAGHATADVRIGFLPETLTVEVTDNGRGPGIGPPAAGHGLVGMRERVALYGGALRIGPRPGGGYRVYARISTDRPNEPATTVQSSQG